MKKTIILLILSLISTFSYSSTGIISFHGYVGASTCRYSTSIQEDKTFVNLIYSGNPTLTVEYYDKSTKIIQLDYQQSDTNQKINIGTNVSTVTCM